jgi:membrane-bound lytic murein transglycosylase D
MTRKSGTSIIFCCLTLGASSSPLFSQQSSFQTSFFSPAAARLTLTGTVADVVETENLPYINQVAKEKYKTIATFSPNGSDLLIQDAEQKFRAGKKFYQERDYTNARSSFDAVIDAMLKAAVDPTDRALYQCKLEDIVDSISRYDLSGMGAAEVSTVGQFDKAPLEDIVTMTFPVDPRIKDKVRLEMKTTASSLPLMVNDVVLGYINYFSGRGRRTIEYGFEREGKYQPMISRILAEEGIPQELIHLAQAESGFLPRAVSRAAAKGMWQFVQFRGNQYGLMQTPYSDDRYDPEKATRAAAHHLHDLYNEFHDWYLAIAAYNCGPGAIERAVEKTGYADYWELRARHAIPVETSNYVPIILAMTIMAKNAPEYGLDHISPDQPLEYDTLQLDSPTNLALIGDLTDTPFTELQQLNPALLRGTAPGGYELRVPKGMSAQLSAALDKVPAEVRISSRMHRVEAGEDLATIAHRYNSTPKTIAAMNTLADSQPAAGDQLVIPAAYREPVAAPVRAKATARTSRGSSRTVASLKKPATKSGGAPVKVASSKAPAHRNAGMIAQVSHKPVAVIR